MHSIVRGDLRTDICSDERSLVTRPTRSDALQHHAFSHDVLRHDADRSHPEPVLSRHGDGGRLAAVHDSILSLDVLQRGRHDRHHHILHAYIPFCRGSSSRHLLPNTGELLPDTGMSIVDCL